MLNFISFLELPLLLVVITFIGSSLYASFTFLSCSALGRSERGCSGGLPPEAAEISTLIGFCPVEKAVVVAVFFFISFEVEVYLGTAGFLLSSSSLYMVSLMFCFLKALPSKTLFYVEPSSRDFYLVWVSTKFTQIFYSSFTIDLFLRRSGLKLCFLVLPRD